MPADPAAMFTAWPSLLDMAARLEHEDLDGAPELDRRALERPVPVLLQVFGIGLNYADHAASRR